MRIGEYLQIGKKIKNARIQSGMSQSEMAKKLGLSNSAYSNYENSYSEPSVEIITKFCDILGITIPDLLGQELPSSGRSPIRTFSDFLYVLLELRRKGIPMSGHHQINKENGELQEVISFDNIQIVAMVDGLFKAIKDLESGKIDEEEYQMEIDDMMKMFNVSISQYTGVGEE